MINRIKGFFRGSSLLYTIFLMFLFTSCTRKWDTASIQAYVKEPAKGLSRSVVGSQNELFELSYCPLPNKGSTESGLLYFALTSKDGKGLFAFSEVDFGLSTSAISYPQASLVVAENYGSVKNRLLIGFPRTLDGEELKLSFWDGRQEHSLAFNLAEIKKVNHRISQL